MASKYILSLANKAKDRAAAMRRSTILQDLLDAGAIRPECADAFKLMISDAKSSEEAN